MENSREEYLQLQRIGIPVPMAAPAHTEVKWTPPPVEWFKANWDVAFQKDAGRMGVGVIVRDHNGKVRAARSFTKRGVLKPKTGETIASYHAAQLCNFMGLQKVILEGDTKLVVEDVNGKDSN